jgi:hypothetical protein
VRRHVAAALGIVAIAFAIRWWLLQGLILGDDPQEFGVLQQVLASGPDFRDQLQVRFGTWVLNWAAARLLGLSETTVLLPTWLLSSAFGALAYAFLVRWGYGAARAFAGALLVVTAPFEVVLGTCRTNDLYLGGAIAGGLLVLEFWEDRPILQGVALALLVWFGFYVKLWAVFALPALGIYFLDGRRFRALTAFVVASVLVHGATLIVWKLQTGTLMPFISSHAANFPVQRSDLANQWLRYPRMMFVGSEFRTTLFGLVPWIVAVVLPIRAVLRRLDRADFLLLGCWGSILLLIEFFPAGFALDAYYSVPRIFRYLAPISFPLTLHAAKLVLDVSRGWRPALASGLVAGLLVVNLFGDVDATLPGRIFRRALFATVHDIERMAPPRVVAEISLAFWLERLYLDPEVVETEVGRPPEIYVADEVQHWLEDTEATWPTGTLLVTGLGNYVHYGAHIQSFRLGWFQRPLDDRWEIAADYGSLTYLPRPEEARLWRLVRGAARSGPPIEHDDPPPPGDMTSADRMKDAMQRFQANDQRGARAQFRALMDTKAPEAYDAAFFYATTFFRESKWERAQREFKRLIAVDPRGRWAPAAHWHIAISDARRGRVRRARARFASIVRRFPQDAVTGANSLAELRRLSRLNDGILPALWRRLTQGKRPEDA